MVEVFIEIIQPLFASEIACRIDREPAANLFIVEPGRVEMIILSRLQRAKIESFANDEWVLEMSGILCHVTSLVTTSNCSILKAEHRKRKTVLGLRRREYT